MQFTSTVPLCNVCLTNAGLDPPVSVLGDPPSYQIMVPAPFDQTALISQLATYLATAAPCPHYGATPEQIAASDIWADLNTKLVALPAVPDPPAVDPYATIRARLTTERDSALQRANDLGGLA